MVADFLKAAQQKEDGDRAERWARYQSQAEAKKDAIVEIYEKYFPLLCSSLDLRSGASAWLAKGEYDPRVHLSGYGAPGILIDGFIFAVHGNSYCTSFVVAKYEGEGVSVSSKVEIMSESLRHDEQLAKWMAKQ